MHGIFTLLYFSAYSTLKFDGGKSSLVDMFVTDVLLMSDDGNSLVVSFSPGEGRRSVCLRPMGCTPALSVTQSGATAAVCGLRRCISDGTLPFTFRGERATLSPI